MPMNQLPGNVIWITGASSGIGKALALSIAKNNPDDRVVVSSRSMISLEANFKMLPNIYYYSADVADEVAMQQVASQIESTFGRLDRLYVNAGICEYIDAYPVDLQSVHRVMNTNVIGAIQTVNVALPLLKQSKAPRIVAISSQVIFAPFPRAGLYAASKVAMNAFFESLQLDLIHEPVEITLVYPGFVDTPASPDKSFNRPFMMTAEQAAERILTGVNQGKARVIFPKRLYWLLKLKHFTRLWESIVVSEKNKQNNKDFS
ncbi:MAG: SDR family NAD(P)-dependent oxidoreductase [Cellvibrionales bacterium]|nr:SDR family NAD(P)-dependent oxidoreductase [Cellvibrionales bacterium]